MLILKINGDFICNARSVRFVPPFNVLRKEISMLAWAWWVKLPQFDRDKRQLLFLNILDSDMNITDFATSVVNITRSERDVGLFYI